ncbi:MAG: translation initiation factor IF-2 subunit gamma [Candidatus Nezhaarchaeales archaeon]
MLMATMLAGATLFDGAILVIDATVPCPQPQTREHLKALEIMNVKNVVVVQNKIEVVPKEKVIENYRQIREFLKDTMLHDAPIIPISALHKANLDVLIEAIEKRIPTPKRDPTKPLRALIARSFDVNRPGTPPHELKGGVLGGSIIQGIAKVGDEIEIRPGIRVEKSGGRVEHEPLFTEIVSLKAGDIEVEEARPGGLIGFGTLLDPSLTKADSLAGNVIGKPGTLPPTLSDLDLEVFLFERAVGTVDMVKVESIKPNEVLMINVGTTTTLGTVVKASKDVVSIKLRRPVCAEPGTRAAISRQIAGRFRLIGYGIIR